MWFGIEILATKHRDRGGVGVFEASDVVGRGVCARRAPGIPGGRLICIGARVVPSGLLGDGDGIRRAARDILGHVVVVVPKEGGIFEPRPDMVKIIGEGSHLAELVVVLGWSREGRRWPVDGAGLGEELPSAGPLLSHQFCPSSG